METIYIYQADIYCEECGTDIAFRTAKPDYPKPWDTNDFPMAVDNEESDCPEHCASCQVFLENPLTKDGQDYVLEAVWEAAVDGKGLKDIVLEWFNFYDYINYADVDNEDINAALSLLLTE